MAFGMTLVYCAGVVAAVVMALRFCRMMQHVTVRVERGYVSGAGAPADVVCQATAWDTRTGDLVVTEVCRCGASRPLGTKSWNRFFCNCS